MPTTKTTHLTRGKILATIDVMSGGRLIVGVGAGWLEEEFVAIGAPPFAERGTATDEYLMAFRELWTKDKPRFDGRFVKFSDILFAPKPVQKPCPALWIGGESGPAMRRAARIGDGWYPIGANPQHRLDTMARYRAAVERLRKLAADVGRDPASVALAFRVHRHGASAPAKADNGERFLFSGSNAEAIEAKRAECASASSNSAPALNLARMKQTSQAEQPNVPPAARLPPKSTTPPAPAKPFTVKDVRGKRPAEDAEQRPTRKPRGQIRAWRAP